METVKHANLSLITAFHPKVCPSPLSFEVILTTRRIDVVRFHWFHSFNFDALRSMGSPSSGLKRGPIYSTEKKYINSSFYRISSLVKCNQICPDSKIATSAIGIFVGFCGDLYQVRSHRFQSGSLQICASGGNFQQQNEKPMSLVSWGILPRCIFSSIHMLYQHVWQDHCLQFIFRVASLDRSFFRAL